MELDPINRTEVFLSAAAGNDIDLPRPITREEVFLSSVAGYVKDAQRSAEWVEGPSETLETATDKIKWTLSGDATPDKVLAYRCVLAVPTASAIGGIIYVGLSTEESAKILGYASNMIYTSARHDSFDFVNDGGKVGFSGAVGSATAQPTAIIQPAKTVNAYAWADVTELIVSTTSSSSKFPVDTEVKWYYLAKK